MHSFINELERPVGVYLFGRRMYEIMAVWETLPVHDEPPPIAEYAEIWRAAEKVVYSSSLESVSVNLPKLVPFEGGKIWHGAVDCYSFQRSR